MNNKKKSATGFGYVNLDGESIVSDGLSKREFFAAMAMQGLMAADISSTVIPKIAVKIADETLEELEKESK